MADEDGTDAIVLSVSLALVEKIGSWTPQGLWLDTKLVSQEEDTDCTVTWVSDGRSLRMVDKRMDVRRRCVGPLHSHSFFFLRSSIVPALVLSLCHLICLLGCLPSSFPKLICVSTDRFSLSTIHPVTEKSTCTHCYKKMRVNKNVVDAMRMPRMDDLRIQKYGHQSPL